MAARGDVIMFPDYHIVMLLYPIVMMLYHIVMLPYQDIATISFPFFSQASRFAGYIIADGGQRKK